MSRRQFYYQFPPFRDYRTHNETSSDSSPSAAENSNASTLDLIVGADQILRDLFSTPPRMDAEDLFHDLPQAQPQPQIPPQPQANDLPQAQPQPQIPPQPQANDLPQAQPQPQIPPQPQAQPQIQPQQVPLDPHVIINQPLPQPPPVQHPPMQAPLNIQPNQPPQNIQQNIHRNEHFNITLEEMPDDTVEILAYKRLAKAAIEQSKSKNSTNNLSFQVPQSTPNSSQIFSPHKITLKSHEMNQLHTQSAHLDSQKTLLDTNMSLINALEQITLGDIDPDITFNNLRSQIRAQAEHIAAQQAKVKQSFLIANHYKPTIQRPTEFAISSFHHPHVTVDLLKSKNILNVIKIFNPLKPHSDFCEHWRRIMTYCKGHLLSQDNYIYILGLTLDGPALRTLDDITPSNPSLDNILDRMVLLYGTKRTILDDQKDLERFVRNPNEDIKTAMGRAQSLCDRIRPLYSPQTWPDHCLRTLKHTLKTVITDQTRNYLDNEELKCLKIGADLDYESMLDLVDTYEISHNCKPTTLTGLTTINPTNSVTPISTTQNNNVPIVPNNNVNYKPHEKPRRPSNLKRFATSNISTSSPQKRPIGQMDTSESTNPKPNINDSIPPQTLNKLLNTYYPPTQPTSQGLQHSYAQVNATPNSLYNRPQPQTNVYNRPIYVRQPQNQQQPRNNVPFQNMGNTHLNRPSYQPQSYPTSQRYTSPQHINPPNRYSQFSRNNLPRSIQSQNYVPRNNNNSPNYRPNNNYGQSRPQYQLYNRPQDVTHGSRVSITVNDNSYYLCKCNSLHLASTNCPTNGMKPYYNRQYQRSK